MIQVTKPFLPPIEEYFEFVRGIYKRNWLTNNGPLVNELELKLKEYLQLPHLLYVNNGTIALQLAIKALELKGEIITTPFTHVATTSSISWEGCEPVFVDIEEDTFNIDPEKVESSITKNTTAIIATHVYGNPCNIDALGQIAEKYNLKVIYDAAHCFGTKYKGKSVFCYGDISTTSFHATKVFHTIEGGAVFTEDPELLKKMSYMRNFGHNGPEDFSGVGINGKNSEFHAAMGVVNLKYADIVLKKRRSDSELYDYRLSSLGHRSIILNKNAEFNYAYYPVILENEAEVLSCMEELNANKIFPRRYFYPSLSSLCYLKKQHTPISDAVSKKIICLPLSYDMDESEIDLICRIIIRNQKYPSGKTVTDSK